MKKIRYETILFIVNAIYMILELIASRILTPFFGSSNLVWTSVIGIILLSSSLGNYIGGIIADKKEIVRNLRIVILCCGLSILVIPLIQISVLSNIATHIPSIKIGAIIATIMLFFIPSMIIGIVSPIIIKLKMQKIEDAGKTSGRIYALATLGSLVGTFLGGFYLVPMVGSTQLLYVLAIVTLLLVFLVEFKGKKDNDQNEIENEKMSKICVLVLVIICSACLFESVIENNINTKKMLAGELGYTANFDTQYGSVKIFNAKNTKYENIKVFLVGNGFESTCYLDEDRRYELSSDYTRFYDLMFKSNTDIKNVAMIGGAGYSYPKYFLHNYKDKNIDVIEIDEGITDIAKKYFYLQDVIDEGNNNQRINIIHQDGRVFINKSQNKYDAILNDAFTGACPTATLTTIEAVKNIHSMLNENGVYLTNIISSLDGSNSKFIKAEVNTLKQVFKYVYIVPCNLNKERPQDAHNNMVIASDTALDIEDSVELNYLENEEIVLTDNYCPVDVLIPII